MKPTVENFQVINSTSTELEVELTPTIRSTKNKLIEYGKETEKSVASR